MNAESRRAPRVNQQIRAPRVLLIGADGARVGEVARDEALALARRAGLDLVEVAPDARPPVCRIQDYGKAKYEASVRDRHSRQHQVRTETKEIKLQPGIGDHDYQVKLRKVLEFLERGQRVKITVTLRGRMQSRPEAADDMIARIRADVSDVADVDGSPRRVGRNSFLNLTPRTGGTRRPKGRSGHTGQARRAKAEPTTGAATGVPEVPAP